MLSTNLGGRGPDLLDIEHDLRFAFRCPALDVGILNAFFSVHETFLFALFYVQLGRGSLQFLVTKRSSEVEHS